MALTAEHRDEAFDTVRPWLDRQDGTPLAPDTEAEKLARKIDGEDDEPGNRA